MFISYLINVLTLVAISGILALSFDFAAGRTGLINLGQMAIAGVGAYTATILMMRAGFPFLVSVVVACLLCGLLGFLLSLPARKVRGDYFALLTLAFGFIFVTIAYNLGITRGALGIPGIPRPVVLDDPFLFFIFAVLCLFGAYLVLDRVASSPFGRVQGAVRDDETAALALGKSVGRVKVTTLTLSCVVAGLSGALIAVFIRFIDPASFELGDLVRLLAAVIVGGVASRYGAVLGTVVVILVFEPFRFLGVPPEFIGVIRQGIWSLLLLIIIIVRPRGILGKIDL
ncbi:MAG: branched-chain amino acid ABC transporter permease [bacterium]|nr:branched-chain amino acid ABC transporter permease [bacterium]